MVVVVVKVLDLILSGPHKHVVKKPTIPDLHQTPIILNLHNKPTLHNTTTTDES